MILNNYFQIIPNAISPRVCDNLVEYALDLKKKKLNTHKANTSDSNFILSEEEKKEHDKKVRNSNVVWISEKWLLRELYPYINDINKNVGWNYDIQVTEPFQFTIYKRNQHYNWHIDCNSVPYNTPGEPSHGKIRKISMTLLLSNTNDFEGGDLEFDIQDKNNEEDNIKKTKNLMSKGSICVFPSFVYHRVTPVTKGTRYSLVAWTLGPPFK